MTKLNLFFIFLFGAFVKYGISYNPMLTYLPRFHKFTMYPNMSGNVTINQYKERQFVNGRFLLDSDYGIDKVIAVFHRCNPEGINCEYFQAWTINDICPKLQQKNQVWSKWYDSIEPPVVCPVDKKYYTLKNATFEVDVLVRWYPDVTNYSWKVVQKFYAGDIYIGMASFDSSILSYRKKRQPKN